MNTPYKDHNNTAIAATSLASAEVLIPSPAEMALLKLLPPQPKAKRANYEFVNHKKTPYLARRGKPNPMKKKDGSPGDPIPFGNWYVYKTIDGEDHRFSLRTPVYEEARRKYDIWLGGLNKITAKAGSLSSLVPKIIERRKSTRKGHASMVPVLNAQARLMKGCPFMKVPFHDLTNDMVFTQWNEFIETGCQLQEDGTLTYRDYSLNTLQADYELLRAVFRMAVKKHCLPEDHDLLEGVTLEDPDNSCPRCVSELPQEMFHKIRWHIYNGNGNRHPHTPTVFDVYWMSGGRKSSVSNIHTEDVNFAKGTLFFRVAKGRPEGYTLPMSLDLQLLLKEHIEKYDKTPGQRIFDVVRINNSIATACKEAGWIHMHAHDFRHLFACNALERTKNIGLVAKWLGHTDGGILAAQVYATTRDEESRRQMAQNMIFISRDWSVEGFKLMRTKIHSRLSDIAAHIAASPSQGDLETTLYNLKHVMENPLEATGTDASAVLTKGSVVPIGVKNVVINQMVEWIRQNPTIRDYYAKDLLEAKFPQATDKIRRRAMVLTRTVRRQAIKAANADLHRRLVAYFKDHPERYFAWAMHDFPEATICQVKHALLSARGKEKGGPQAPRDRSCPASMKSLLENRKEKQVATAIQNFMAIDLRMEDQAPLTFDI